MSFITHVHITSALRYLGLLVCLLAISACSTTGSLDVPGQLPADVEDRAVVDGEVLPLPEQPMVTAEPMSGAPNMSPVVKRLLTVAQDQRHREDWDGAAESLERALRIEPRNALLWGRLADIRFAQRAWRKAIQLAAKSNTLASNDISLRRQNWYLMANAYEALGDQTAAQKYRSKLTQ
ncbi:tetratricopeptide repeat protein [Arenicella xantha]|uniref:Tetratricopeptide repeat protein n=1 Tax=Arenicella xantha TaxID=644221 RepID=A0A395JSU7_9GAMM|nr:tetratricopeptide repeat protein [Arenicella xantha]RBP53412.1 tetratricopeptide repeat protein [Arenicella xantha]